MPNMFRIKNELLRAKDRFFELVHGSQWKAFLCRYTPKRLQNMFLKRHLRNACSFPVSMSIEITNVCNAGCWFCPQPLSKRQKGYMDFPLYRKIMDEVKENLGKIKSIALFMDGEPTLHRQLVDYLIYGKELGIKNFYVASNMEFFSPELTDRILGADLGKTLQYVICSLHGTNERAYEVNKIGVDFKKVMHNTLYLIEQRNKKRRLYPRIFTRFLVHESAKDEADRFRQYWRGRADKVLCYKMHNWGGKIKDRRVALGNTNGEFMPCYFPFGQFAVQYDGTVRLCCIDSDSSVVIGDIGTESIKDIWNSEKINSIRAYHLNRESDKIPAICKECSYPKKGTWIAPFYWA